MFIHKRLLRLDEIALTFDDGPDPQWTPKILELLEKNEIVATFFLIANKAIQYPHLVQQIFLKGHLIGNHSYSHSFFFPFFSRIFESEWRKSQKIFEELIGKKPRFFRPPRGIYTSSLIRFLEKTEAIFTLWSLMPGDYWFWHTHSYMIKKIFRRMRGGDILVFHDGLNQSTHSDRSRTYELLQKILPILKKQYRLVTLDKGFATDGYYFS